MSPLSGDQGVLHHLDAIQTHSTEIGARVAHTHPMDAYGTSTNALGPRSYSCIRHGIRWMPHWKCLPRPPSVPQAGLCISMGGIHWMPFSPLLLSASPRHIIGTARRDESPRCGNQTVELPAGTLRFERRGAGAGPPFSRAVDRTNNGSGCPAGGVHTPLRPRSPLPSTRPRAAARGPPRRV